MAPKKKDNAEAMRQHRAKIKADAVRHAVYLAKERERYQQRKREGKLLNIQSLSARDQRTKRKKWRNEKRKARAREQEKEDQAPQMVTPPPSPTPPLEDQPGPSDFSPEDQPVEPGLSSSYPKQRGRKRLKRLERKAYRHIEQQNKTIKRMQNRIRNLTRQLHRQSKSKHAQPLQSAALSVNDSPGTKANALVRSGNITKIRRELTYGYALGQQLKKKVIKSRRRHKETAAIRNVVLGPVLRKYRLANKVRKEISLSHHSFRRGQDASVLSAKRKKKNLLGPASNLVKDFFLEDRNSTPAAGKRETITRKKDKRQRRYLTDTMGNLFRQFKSEHPALKLSYTSFTRLRQFYVIPASVGQRDTVKCKIHDNMEMKANKLHSLGVIKSGNLTNIMSSIACSTTNEACMFRSCPKCEHNIKEIYTNTNFDDTTKKMMNEITTYVEWDKAVQKRKTNHGEVDVTVITKVEKSASLSNLCKTFESGLVQLMAHQFRIHHQFMAVRNLKTSLSENECVLQIDFSENYACKGATEVQSFHFGGSREQVTLHTCHATLIKDGKLTTKCFCTLSEDNRHNAASIWAHLEPVITDLVRLGIDTIHFVSDGPTTQYRNKTNFHLMATLPFQRWNIKYISWNLLEASHGKGPADGIGAALKVKADRLVANGMDIFNCTQLLEALKSTPNASTIQLHYVSSNEIDEMMDLVKKLDTDVIKGTMKIHQIISPSKGVFHHRELSCYCGRPCNCYDLKTVTLTEVHEMTSSADKDPVVASIESNLSYSQIELFKRRLAEGYDLEILDLGTLSAEEKQEYLYWKTWKAAKLRQNEQSDSKQESDESDDTESEKDDSSDDEWEVTKEKAKKDRKLQISSSRYYAVFFMVNRRKSFYIGRPTGVNKKRQVEMKFLEHRQVEGTYIYDWPSREDICCVFRTALLREVRFDGPPPFTLSKIQERDIQNAVKVFKNQSSLSDYN